MRPPDDLPEELEGDYRAGEIRDTRTAPECVERDRDLDELDDYLAAENGQDFDEWDGEDEPDDDEPDDDEPQQWVSEEDEPCPPN
jgi:hypothetical protein